MIDPNVFISALMAKPGSAALNTARALATDKLTLVACPHLLTELAEVARREKFRRYFSIHQAESLVAALELKAEMRPDPPTEPRVCADPDDDYLFALAAAADVQLVISGDQKVLAVQLPGIEVLTPRQFVNRLDELIGNPHPWGPTFLAARSDEAQLIAEIRGDDKVLTAAAMFCTQVQRWTGRRYLELLVTPEALPSIRRYRRQVAALVRDRGMTNRPDYSEPNMATVKMTEDPGYPVRSTGAVMIEVVPIRLHRRPELPHPPETGGWRVHHVGDPTRTEPGYVPPYMD